jgi:hypothetical protein
MRNKLRRDADEFGKYIIALCDDVDELVRENDTLRERLRQIKAGWQEGIGELDTPWRITMACLIGDDEGLREASQRA